MKPLQILLIAYFILQIGLMQGMHKQGLASTVPGWIFVSDDYDAYIWYNFSISYLPRIPSIISQSSLGYAVLQVNL